MKDRIRKYLQEMGVDTQQNLINNITSNISPNTNQTKKTKLGTTPVLKPVTPNKKPVDTSSAPDENLSIHDTNTDAQKSYAKFAAQKPNTSTTGFVSGRDSAESTPRDPFKGISPISSSGTDSQNQQRTLEFRPGITPTGPITKPVDKPGSASMSDLVKLKEADSVVPANAMGDSSPSNASSPIAMPEKKLKGSAVLKRPLRDLLNKKA